MFAVKKPAAYAGTTMVLGLIMVLALAGVALADPLPGGTLDPTSIPKYEDPLVIPPAMPRTEKIAVKGGKNINYYEIAMRQFDQYILPESMGMETTVWSYGSLAAPGTVAEGGSFNYPAFTIEAKWEQPVWVKWVNDLVDANGNYLSHLLPVDQTLHWANPSAGPGGTDSRGQDPEPYTGPVPMISHVHGAHTNEESDGYPEAWYLPNAADIPAGYATVGSQYDDFKTKWESRVNELPFTGKYKNKTFEWEPGAPIFDYPNDQRATTLWYHDHSLGMTRLNVYAGPAGFYLLRGGPSDQVLDAGGKAAVLPGPAPALGDAPGIDYYEIPIVVQDRSFNDDGSLFYPDNRAFFEGLDPDQLQIPFIPEAVYYDGEFAGMSDISPIWNPEFFGNTNVVNGRTWPYLEVEQRQYRFRFLNGSQSRFYILKMDDGTTFTQIGNEGGFLPAPLELDELLIGPAERADVIVDFSGKPAGSQIVLENVGPDEPFGGGAPGVDFDAADPGTTGQVMRFDVVAATGADPSTPAAELTLPAIDPLPATDDTLHLSLNEEESEVLLVGEDEGGNIVLDPNGEAFAPKAALLGTFDPVDKAATPLLWGDDVTEAPTVGDTQEWVVHNLTEDAHPIHIHLIMFEVIDRTIESEDSPHFTGESGGEIGDSVAVESWEAGSRKDTFIAYPGESTTVKATFDLAGLFVWHCHILEHEDNEMMRPYRVVEKTPPSSVGLAPNK